MIVLVLLMRICLCIWHPLLQNTSWALVTGHKIISIGTRFIVVGGRYKNKQNIVITESYFFNFSISLPIIYNNHSELLSPATVLRYNISLGL